MRDDRLALITAAAGGGVGRAIARTLAARGCRVVVTDIHEARTAQVAAQLAEEFPATTVTGMVMDIGDPARIDAVVDQVSEQLGPIQILVNNAAVDILGTMLDYALADWERTVAVNLTGPWYLCRRTMPIMRDAGGGVIVNIGSIAADVGGSGFEGPYAVTKDALSALARVCSRDGAAYGIRSVAISPGPIDDTRVMQSNPSVRELPEVRSLSGAFPTTTDIAELVGFLVDDSARHIVGETIRVNGGAYMRG
jgi:NAD(P)-dependent dehydrogenase (short-subunit alcohol dehydrogenase family)